MDEESYAEDSHALILWEIDAAHYALLCLAISTFKESLGMNQSLDDIVLIWDCAAEALLRSSKPSVTVRRDILFNPKFFCSVVGRAEEILKEDTVGLGIFEKESLCVLAADAMEVSRHLCASLRRGDPESRSEPSWMYDLGVCAGKEELYPTVLLYLLCLERCGSKYLLGLPVVSEFENLPFLS